MAADLLPCQDAQSNVPVWLDLRRNQGAAELAQMDPRGWEARVVQDTVQSAAQLRPRNGPKLSEAPGLRHWLARAVQTGTCMLLVDGWESASKQARYCLTEWLGNRRHWVVAARLTATCDPGASNLDALEAQHWLLLLDQQDQRDQLLWCNPLFERIRKEHRTDTRKLAGPQLVLETLLGSKFAEDLRKQGLAGIPEAREFTSEQLRTALSQDPAQAADLFQWLDHRGLLTQAPLGSIRFLDGALQDALRESVPQRARRSLHLVVVAVVATAMVAVGLPGLIERLRDSPEDGLKTAPQST
jgi:hypothetical protein